MDKETIKPKAGQRNIPTNTNVDDYWGRHTVKSSRVWLAKDQLFKDESYLKWRFKIYPKFQEFMQLWGDHEGQVMVDYGCGPGNDLVGFLAFSKAKKVIGIDISEKALGLAAARLAAHKFDTQRYELIQTKDSATHIPLEDNSIDYIYSEGVLHHTSNPDLILKEFHRILKPGSEACIMVYNKTSIWYHLGIAYDYKILRQRFTDLSMDEAFERSQDGVGCPIAHSYEPGVFIKICEDSGFTASFVGGYPDDYEMVLLWELLGSRRYKLPASFLWRLPNNLRKRSLKQVLRFVLSVKKAVLDDRLDEVHKKFLNDLTYDEVGYPIYQGKYAGHGGVYNLRKPA